MLGDKVADSEDKIGKETHHFDVVNWLIGQSPVEVSAFGSLKFYGANGDKKGETSTGD